MRRRSGLGLTGALFCLASAALGAPRAEVLGRFDWQVADDAFGGVSGLELEVDGAGFVVLSDRGRVFTGRFARDADGVVTGADIDGSAMLAGAAGEALARRDRDSEGLAILPDGTLAVSFELNHRLTIQPAAGDPARVFPAFGLDGFNRNSALEALAVDAAGTLWTVTEGQVEGAHAVLRFQNGDWLPALSLPAEGNWRPVGADFAPDRRLYLLERDFWPLVGFMTRILRFAPTDAGLGPAEVLFESRAGGFGNLEGVAVWEDVQWETRLTLVSDNNFLPLLTTEVVELRIVE